MPMLAHRSSDKRTQTLSAHLLGVSDKAGRLAGKFGMTSAGGLLGLLHDLGKATAEFQDYLNSFGPDSEVEPQDEMRGKIDHSTAGAQVLVREVGGKNEHSLPAELARLLALPIVSHHSGMIDAVAPTGEDTLDRRLKKSEAKTRVVEAWRTLDAEVRREGERLMRDPALLQPLRNAALRILHGPDASSQARSAEPGNRQHLQLGLLVRMLFSCLIDADRTDTADFDWPAAARLRQHGRYIQWDALLSRLHDSLGNMPGRSAVNKLRHQISRACYEAAARPRGVYTLTVPTGGGKTLAALRFALRHAELQSTEVEPVDRIVFVSPYISIVDQNAAVARRILEPEGVPFATVVLEHHSNLPGEDGRQANGVPSREHWRRKVLAENWDAPVVFTTMVQVLEALFGGGTRPVRRLHALARSVIIFDEAQTVPLRMLHLFNNAVNFLVQQCGATVLLCTATQPRLHTVDAAQGAIELAENSELMDDVPALFRDLRRYTVDDQSSRPGGWTPRQVAEAACASALGAGSCLVVLNTKRDAREIFDLCKQQLPHAKLVHLSTGMCPMHREEKLTQLKRWLEEQTSAGFQPEARPVVCVSTQLIEAGVDIDFAAVIRDLAGLDSIAQAAGRCNRHGERAGGGRVLIVKLPDPPKNLQEILQGRQCAERVLGEWRRHHPGQPFPLDDSAQMELFFSFLLHERAKEMSYAVEAKKAGRDNTLLSMLGKNVLAVREAADEGKPISRVLLRQSFMTAGALFQTIAPTQGVIVPFREGGKEIVNELCAAYDLGAEWQILRRAQRYTISMYAAGFQRLQRDDAVYEVQAGTGVFCLRPEWYDLEYGLRVEEGLMEAQFA